MPDEKQKCALHSKSNVLMPCPFCGDTPEIESRRGNEHTAYAEVVTVNCCVSMTFSDDQNPMGGYAIPGTAIKKAIKAWNTRTLQPITSAGRGENESVNPGAMTPLMWIVKGFSEAGIPTTLRQDNGFQYLFVGEPEDAANIYDPEENFETSDLQTLLTRHKFFEFENGDVASWGAS